MFSLISRAQIVVQILNQLRPVVFQIVTEVLEITSTTYLDAEELTNTIMVRLTPIIEIGVNEESEKVLNSEQTKVQKNNLVLQITSELKPTIIRLVFGSYSFIVFFQSVIYSALRKTS